MENIKIISTGSYLPQEKIENDQLAKKHGVTEEYIEQVTGIKTRYYSNQQETVIYLAIQAAKEAMKHAKIDKQEIGLIITASTTTSYLMPGISFQVQKDLEILSGMCMDILAGCSGYINAFDIARQYIALGKIQYALIIGVDVLSHWTDEKDLGTSIILSDGAGATIIGKSEEKKQYDSNIVSEGKDGDILTTVAGKKLKMEGKKIYKYAVTKTVENLHQLLKKTDRTLEDITYVVPHQSNMRIMESICERLELPNDKMYMNIDHVGNTFCASIPIALDEMFKQGKLKIADQIILLGYGGGLNTGSILLEI